MEGASKWGCASQQFIEHRAEAVDIGARVDIGTVELRLLRAHISGRAEKMFEGGEQGLVREPLIGGLGNPKINYLGHRRNLIEHQDVRGLDVPMDDPFLVRMLDRLANSHE